jgi:hypothetical protein
MNILIQLKQPEIPKQHSSLESCLQWTEDTLVYLYKLLHSYQTSHFTLEPDNVEYAIHEQISKLHIIKAQVEDILSVMN